MTRSHSWLSYAGAQCERAYSTALSKDLMSSGLTVLCLPDNHPWTLRIAIWVGMPKVRIALSVNRLLGFLIIMIIPLITLITRRDVNASLHPYVLSDTFRGILGCLLFILVSLPTLERVLTPDVYRKGHPSHRETLPFA